VLSDLKLDRNQDACAEPGAAETAAVINNRTQELLFSALSHILRAADADAVAGVADEIMFMSLQMLYARQSADAVEESLLVANALIVKRGAAFATYLPVFGPYLLVCLLEFSEPGVCIAAVGIVSDLFLQVGAERVFHLCDRIMQVLFAKLEVRTLTCIYCMFILYLFLAHIDATVIIIMHGFNAYFLRLGSLSLF
jgi:hypothetical protein